MSEIFTITENDGQWDVAYRNGRIVGSYESKTLAESMVAEFEKLNVIIEDFKRPKPNAGLILYKDGRTESVDNISRRAKEIIAEATGYSVRTVDESYRFKAHFDEKNELIHYVFDGIWRVVTKPKNFAFHLKRKEQLDRMRAVRMKKLEERDAFTPARAS